jgi:acyl-coenzyme A thioesterase PaaI-like protein
VTIHDLVAGIPYARFIGITVREEDGGALTLMRFRDGLVGNRRLPAIHGGVVGAFLEMAAIIELVHEMGGDRIPKPINFNVNYLRTAGPKVCVARGEVVKLGKRNQSMPLTDPKFSSFYYSHPPLLERLAVLRRKEPV